MTKKIIILAIIIIFSTVSIFAVNQFFIMPWDGSDLPKMENPKIVIKKKARTLEVFDGDKLIKSYSVALGFKPTGDKEIEGDGKTPEGDFYIFTKNAESSFYLSLGVSYPNTEDAQRGLREKLITQEEHDAIIKAIEEMKMPPQNTRLGGEIYIHGHGNAADWTAGCVALTNADMKELFDAMAVKTPVRIEP
jgi:murein L,D-transpeptidase YafK